MTLSEESKDVNCKIQEIGVDWYLPYEMAADSARGLEG